MNFAVYYLTLPFLYGLSLLPFRVLPYVSWGMYLVIYKLLGYRQGVVHSNLTNAFPGMPAEKILLIQDRFYRYFCELILETVKTLTISPRNLQKQVTFGDMTVFEELYEQEQSVIIVMGHLGNWELAGARFSQMPLHQLYVIYHPLSNPFFDRLFFHMRTRLGNKLYAMKDAFRGMIKDREQITATAFIADQTPAPESAFWTTFLNQDTPVFTGPAKIAKKMKYPIVYVSVKRLQPCYYEVSGELLMENPDQYTIEEITECHTRRLEKDIIARPETWLWTHRRWKHKRPNFGVSSPDEKRKGVNHQNT